jgi:hypothetical protein
MAYIVVTYHFEKPYYFTEFEGEGFNITMKKEDAKTFDRLLPAFLASIKYRKLSKMRTTVIVKK